jgi:hypothetical protein
VTNGRIDLSFADKANHCKLDAIEIVPTAAVASR